MRIFRVFILTVIWTAMLLVPSPAGAATSGWTSMTKDWMGDPNGTYASYSGMRVIAAAKGSGSYGVNAAYLGAGAAAATAAAVESGIASAHWRGPPWRVTFTFNASPQVTSWSEDSTFLYYFRPYAGSSVTPHGWAAPYLTREYCNWNYGYYECYTASTIDYDAAEYIYATPMACAPASSYCTPSTSATYSVDVYRSGSYPLYNVAGIYYEMGFTASAYASGESNARAESDGTATISTTCIYC